MKRLTLAAGTLLATFAVPMLASAATTSASLNSFFTWMDWGPDTWQSAPYGETPTINAAPYQRAGVYGIFSVYLQDIQASVTYGGNVYDNATGAYIPPGGAVTVGQALRFVFAPHSNADITWWSSGWNAVHGTWNNLSPGPSCSAQNYIGTQYDSYYGPTVPGYDYYDELSLSLPSESLGNTGGLSCGGGSVDGGGNATVVCTVTGTGGLNPTFDFSSVQGHLWFSYYDHGWVDVPASTWCDDWSGQCYDYPGWRAGPDTGAIGCYDYSNTNPPEDPYRGYAASMNRGADGAFVAGASLPYPLSAAPPPSPPTATLSVNPSSFSTGQTAVLSWSSTNATSCAGTGFSTGGATSGTIPNFSPSVVPDQTEAVDCTGPGGTAHAAATTHVVPAPPTCTLAASPETIPAGGSASLTWSCTGATSCTASGGFSTGGAANNPSGVAVSPANDANYQLTCTGPGGTSVSNIEKVTVLAPTVSIQANPARVNASTGGANTTVTWTSANVTSCSIEKNGAAWSYGGTAFTNLAADGAGQVNGSSPDAVMTQSTYRIECQNGTGTVSANATAVVNVNPGYAEF